MNTPTWFKVVAIVALLWNVLGCLALFSDLRLLPEDLFVLSLLGMLVQDFGLFVLADGASLAEPFTRASNPAEA